jgi:putative transcription factor
MPSGPALHQSGSSDWQPVVWQKAAPTGKASKSSAAINQARRTGQAVETDRKLGSANSAGATPQNAAKLDENGENFKHATVSHDFKMALQQARFAKKMSQAALATAINEKGSVINDYEAGKAIPAGPIINKLNRALGVRLPKAK